MKALLMLRCLLCAGLNHTTLHGQLLRCKLCSLGFRKDSGVLPSLDAYQVGDGGFHFPNWNTWSGRIMRGLAVDPRQPFHFSPPTVRMFAAQKGRHVTTLRSSLPFVPVFAPWAYGRTIRAVIGPRSEPAWRGPEPRLTLGIIAARDAWQEALDLCVDMASHAAEVIVVLDTADAAVAAVLEGELRSALGEASGERPRGVQRVLAHPLQADFAAQRNRIQQAARTEWVLQLDCDERLTAGTKLALPGIIEDAGREGWDAVAFTRRNLVDGVPSALYPDVQYRLLRRSVRFTRAVHEYPLLGPGQASFVHLGAGIIHTLASERLERRGASYEAIQQGAGRPHDTALLRLPIEAGVMAPA